MSDPNYLLRTYTTVIPNFLAAATRTWLGDVAAPESSERDAAAPALRRAA